MKLSVWKDPEAIRRFLASEELGTFCTGDMPSMDSAWHYRQQEKYDKVRRRWMDEWKP
jgi:hypothetical protein